MLTELEQTRDWNAAPAWREDDTPDEMFARWLLAIAAECGCDRTSLVSRRHRHVYGVGDRDQSLYYLHDGWVAIQVPCPDGRPVNIDLLGPGAVFGETCMVSGEQRTDSAIALRYARLTRVPVAAIVPRLDEPRQADLLLNHLARRIAESRRRFVALREFKSEQRLALVLERLLRKFGYPAGNGLFGLNSITQQDLAGVVGTTRARISQFLQRFEAANLIRGYRDSTYLADPDALLRHVMSTPAGTARRARPDQRA